MLKVRIISSSSQKGGTYYSRGGILTFVKAAYWGVLGLRGLDNRGRPGIFSSPQAGAATPVVTLADGTDGAHIRELLLWTSSSSSARVEPVAGLARAKAPAVFLTVHLNFSMEPVGA